ncbi:MAG: hypothetical protein ABIC04_07910 [Nanoarchaeota archaeon]
MKYKLEWITFGRASRGWTLEIQVCFPTRQQFTWETYKFSNQDSGLKPSHSAIWTFIKFWWVLRKEIKLRQALPGNFKLA